MPGLYTDIPSRPQIDALLNAREAASVSLYLPTDPANPNAAPIAFKDLARQALDQLRAAGTPKGEVEALDEHLTDLHADSRFWRFQARSLAVFATPARVRTFRLPNHLQPQAAVADRFHVKPLLRSVTFPQSGYLLALAQGSVRLMEIAEGVAGTTIDVPDLPEDVASAVGKASIKDRSPARRVQGSEGQKMRMRQYARQIDEALRAVLPSGGVPLVLAGAEPLLSIFREVCSYPDVAEDVVSGNPEGRGDAELTADARKVLDEVHAAALGELKALFAERSSQGRTVVDVGDAARFATQGAVDTVFVDFDATVPGTVDDNGEVSYSEEDDAVAYGVVDEIARRVWLSGGRVLAVRREDVPEGGDVAAILRYAP
ncbi:baeRF11 domain-containing protein [Phytomonospora endophytica]|uniref:Uncharacterized protein n=1 Tax=Phytomonospora endophytica TaxID=714109 RepID=A0A841FYD6_9ACTN|nr:hypothetical protein [Phytomonospora endophytica]MBB6039753.1 hypothetical protein [Phytomonospora endophytica]GIG70911.1 hypothetical protein Pen01_72060 [Phytomonospora endophytica]